MIQRRFASTSGRSGTRIVAPSGLIDPGEVPDGWGLMVPPANGRGRKFRVVKKAAGREPAVTASLGHPSPTHKSNRPPPMIERSRRG